MTNDADFSLSFLTGQRLGERQQSILMKDESDKNLVENNFLINVVTFFSLSVLESGSTSLHPQKNRLAFSGILFVSCVK